MTTIFGSTRRVTFRIPTSIVVPTPTAYQVSIAGTTSDGTPFSSGNTAALTVDPAARIVSVSPNTGQAGQSLSVTITGQFTNFVQGSTQASFGAGISVGGGPSGGFGLVTVNSLTSATAQLAIDATALAGLRTVSVQTGNEQAALADGFTVQAGGTPTLVSVSPNSGRQGQSIVVTITGQFTNFVQGITQASFGDGIAVGGGTAGGFGPVDVSSPTSATAVLVIDAAAAVGLRTVTVQTGPEQVSLTNGFTVTGAGANPIVTITSPAPLTLFGKSPITVTGTVDNSSDTVVVNGVTATVDANGQFTAQNVPLREGGNIITATATDTALNVGTASVTVTLKTTPPTIRILAPSDGAVLTSSTVTVAGNVNDTVTGTVNPEQVSVSVNGVAATVSNRTFTVVDLPLVAGTNTITAVASDKVGNQSQHQIQVSFRASIAQQRILIVSGNNQSGLIGTVLPNPLVTQAVNTNGAPIENRQLTFTVVKSDGVLNSISQQGQQVAVQTDKNGLASVTFQLGTRVGAGNNEVSVSSPGFVGEVVFCQTATPDKPDKINVVSGDNQNGVVGTPLAEALVAIVLDRGGNPLAGVPVTFKAVQGGGNFVGADMLTVNSDSNGKAAAILTLGQQEGINNNVVTASFEGLAGTPATYTASGRVGGPAANTIVSGVVLDNANVPIPGVSVKILSTNIQEVFTNQQGRFSISGAPVGTVRLLVDGSTQTSRPETFPFLVFMLTTIAGQDNTIGGPMLLPPLDMANAQMVGGDKDVVLKMKGVPGYEFTVFAHSVTKPDGSPYVGPLSLSQVHSDKVPMVPPNGSAPDVAGTLQPAGLHFNPPIRTQFPNTSGLAPGTVIDIFSFDHDLEDWVSQGLGRVSADGSVIVSDPGFGITKSGWHFAPPPPPPRNCVSGCDNGDPCSKHECKDGACVDTPDKADGTACELSKGRSLTSAGITVNIDKSCTKGTCKNGTCEPKSDRWGLDKISAAATDAMNKILQPTDDKGCMGDPIKKTMTDNLKAKGLNITCVDSSSSAGGGDDCGSSFLGDKTFTLSNLGAARCGSLAKTIRHESQHGAGNTGHVKKADGSLDCSKDHVYACDQACFGANNCGAIDAATAKANCN